MFILGNLIFQCTLCERKYQNGESLAQHVRQKHKGSGKAVNFQRAIVEKVVRDELGPIVLRLNEGKNKMGKFARYAKSKMRIKNERRKLILKDSHNRV